MPAEIRLTADPLAPYPPESGYAVASSATHVLGASDTTLAIPVEDSTVSIGLAPSAAIRAFVDLSAITYPLAAIPGEQLRGVPVGTGGRILSLPPGRHRILTLQGAAATTCEVTQFGASLVARANAKLCSYPAIVAAAANWGLGTASVPTEHWDICDGHQFRVRQDGTARTVKFYVRGGNFTAGNLNAALCIYRGNPGAGAAERFNLVAQSQDILTAMGVANATVTLALTPNIQVRRGDYLGWYWKVGNAANTANVLVTIGGLASDIYYQRVATPTADYDWRSKTKGAGLGLPVELWGSGPEWMEIGDSIIAGHGDAGDQFYSYVENFNTITGDWPQHSIGSYLSTLVGARTHQNMGIGSQTTTNIEARFAADVVAYAPSYVLVNGGVNDIAGAVPEATFLANWTSILDACNAAGIKAVVLLILPWTAGTDAQMLARDTWNADLRALAESKGACVVDAGGAVGKARATGPRGNLWDIQAAYAAAGGVHYLSGGYALIAQAIYQALGAKGWA